MNLIRDWLIEHLSEPAARAGAVFALALVAAFVLDRISTLVLRVLVRKTRTELDDALIAALHRPVIMSMLLIGAWQALLLLHEVEPPVVLQTLSPETSLSNEAAERRSVLYTLSVTLRLLQTLGLLVWTGFVLRAGTLVLRGAAANDRVRAVQPSSFPLFNHASKLLVLAIAVYLSLKVWSVDATGWLASAGILGIVVGLAAQDSLANLFAGAFILADGPYKIGDYILLDSGERGMVTAIGLRSTRLLTRDDIEIIIPNSVMGQAKIINETGGPVRRQRVRVRVSVAYGSDLQVVREELMASASDVSMVVADPEPRVRFRSFGDSGLDHELLCWIPEAALRGRAVDAINTRISERFTAAGISIPFPQRDLHVRTVPSDFLDSNKS